MPKAKSEKIVFYGTGRRKKSIARVRLVEGTGVITINGRDIDEYFGAETLKVIVRQPLTATDTVTKYDVIWVKLIKTQESCNSMTAMGITHNSYFRGTLF